MALELQNRSEPSFNELVQGIVGDVQDLTQQQLRLFKAELKEDFAKTRDASMPLLLSIPVVLTGLLILGIGLAQLLFWAFPDLTLWGSYCLVGTLIVAIGGGLAYSGYAKFKSFNPLPDQSLEALKENLKWPKPK
jgi:uncharacterized membrane protein YqjE